MNGCPLSGKQCPETCKRSSLEGYGIYYCLEISEDNGIRCPIQLAQEQYAAVKHAVAIATR
jgi:hypothetical protein